MSMKRHFAAALVALVSVAALAPPAAAQGGEDAGEARRLLNEGARAHREGRFDEARQWFERLAVLDPTHKLAPLFVARVARQQYKPGDETPENLQKGREAVEAYKRVLESAGAEPRHKREAYDAVAHLYRKMRDADGEREWLRRRAEDPSEPIGARAHAYTVLASERWNCSHEITERRENKETVNTKEQGAVLRYKRPLDQAAFEQAQGCVGEGLSLVEQAITLQPDDRNAWAYKSSLLREMAKFAEMNGDPAGKAEYTRQAEEAAAQYKKLGGRPVDGTDESDIKHGGQARTPDAAGGDEDLISAPKLEQPAFAGPSEAAIVQASPAQPPGPVGPTARGGERPALAPGGRTVVTGGVLNGKAVHAPPPAYPAAAKAARASGSVILQVQLDEEGKVTEAVAQSGHPLLRAAAAEAVRQWRFTPTLLSGQPVKVRGTVVVNFKAQ